MASEHQLHFVQFHTVITLIFFRKFRDELMYRDNSNVLFKIEFLYVTADCKKKHGKKIHCYIVAARLNGCRKVVTFYITQTLHAYCHFISLTDLEKKNQSFSFHL